MNEKVVAKEKYFELSRLLHMDRQYFETNIWPHMFYMSYQDIWRWKMNVARVMGNSRDPKYITDLVQAFEDNPDERVRGMAVWAIGNIGGPQARTALSGLSDETSDLVQGEIRQAKEACKNLSSKEGACSNGK